MQSLRFDNYGHFAEIYNTYRPHPPPIVFRILTRIACIAKPKLVVDLGSGTGISTFAWSDFAERVIGIERNANLRHFAERKQATSERYKHISFQASTASNIEIQDQSVDVVTCAQSLHWMEPDSTLREAKRILRSGGLFAAYDYLFPPSFNWKVERAFDNFINCVNAWEKKLGQSTFGTFHWKPREFVEKMRKSGHFQYVRELYIHNTDEGDFKKLIGLALSYGDIHELLNAGATTSELGLDELINTARRIMSKRIVKWLISYIMRIAIR